MSDMQINQLRKTSAVPAEAAFGFFRSSSGTLKPRSSIRATSLSERLCGPTFTAVFGCSWGLSLSALVVRPSEPLPLWPLPLGSAQVGSFGGVWMRL